MTLSFEDRPRQKGCVVVPTSSSRRPLAEGVFDRLFDDIVSGALAPGTALPPERVLTEQFGVNRQVVREAIKRLAHLGMVTQQHGNGNLVRDWTSSGSFDLLAVLASRSAAGFDRLDPLVARSLLELRQACGTQTAVLFAARGDELSIHQLEVLVAEMVVSDDPMERFRLVTRFWSVVAEGADNLAFQLMHNSLEKSLVTVGMLMGQFSETVPGDPRDYQQLVEAFGRGDASEVEQVATRLLRIEPTALARQSGLFADTSDDLAGSAGPPR